MRGLIFVIGGTDGSGKSTQAPRIVDRLDQMGYKSCHIHFPDYDSPTGKFIKEVYLAGKLGPLSEVGAYQAGLLYAVDRWAASKKIKRLLAENYIVILDRYVESNLAFQGCKISDPAERQEFYDYIENLEYEHLKIPRPKLNIILHISAIVSLNLRRIREKQSVLPIISPDIHEQDFEYLKKAEKIYLEISSRPGYQLLECEEDGKILPIEIITDKIWESISPLLPPLV